MQNLSFRNKVVLGFAVVLLGVAGLGGFAMLCFGRLSAAATDFGFNALPATETLGRLSAGFEADRAMQGAVLLMRDGMARQEIQAQMGVVAQQLQALHAKYDPAMVSPGAGRALADTIAAGLHAYARQSKRLGALVAAGKQDEAAAFYTGPMLREVQALRTELAEDLELTAAAGARSANAAKAIGHAATVWILVAVAAIATLCAGIGWAMLRGLSAPIIRITAAMRRLADRDLDAEIPCVGRHDEVGAIAAAVQVFRDNMARARALEAEQLAVAAARQRRAEATEALIVRFEQEVGSLVGMLASASAEMQQTAQAMSATAEDTNGRATIVASAAQEASAGAQTVAAAAEQLTSSISEISRQVAQSASVTSRAVADARHTDTIVQSLAESAQKIGDVVSLITNIAGQTNLLALNATIEAARAGDAGRGFAVVASEVKSLAQQTARATEEIGAQIGQIQGATGEVVKAIRGITGIIEEVSTIAAAIAAAVEEQGGATAEIARNVQQTAASARDVTVNIGDVSRAAHETGAAAAQVLGAAGGLSRHAEQLSGEVKGFIEGVRAA
ncbi:MAG TPA: methyl-accepting chemotaxis protein [Acetobacteraceae bacterium]|nr:methyl-accepting chemotaxis protein [Acetobacteraceae bacterium]